MGNMVSRPLSVHQEHELLGKMEVAGLDRELAQRIIDSKGNRLAAEVVELVRGESLRPITRRGRAREIMGGNFFGLDEVEKYFRVCPTFRQTLDLSWVPYSEVTLQACKDTHVLVAVFPFSILDISDWVQKQCLMEIPLHKGLLNEQAFIVERGEAGWWLIRKTLVEGSTLKMWDEQLTAVSAHEVVPPARVMTYAIIGHFLATGERLFKEVRVRCPDVLGDARICVGPFYSSRLFIDEYLDIRADSLGIASARKPDFPVRR